MKKINPVVDALLTIISSSILILFLIKYGEAILNIVVYVGVYFGLFIIGGSILMVTIYVLFSLIFILAVVFRELYLFIKESLTGNFLGAFLKLMHKIMKL